MKKSESLKYGPIADAVYQFMTTGATAEGYGDYIQYFITKQDDWQKNEESTLADIVYTIIHDEIIEFYSGGVCTEDIDNSELAMDAIIGAEKGWQDLPCDPEGATKEQNETMERYLNKVINQVADGMEVEGMIKSFVGAIYTYNADPAIVENEEEANEIFRFIKDCTNHEWLTPENGEEFETACAKLGLQTTQTDKIEHYWIDGGKSILICYEWE